MSIVDLNLNDNNNIYCFISITGLLVLLASPLGLHLSQFLSDSREGVVGAVIVSRHGDGRRRVHKGIIIRHLRRRCVVVLGGGIRRGVSLAVESVKRFDILFVLLTAPRVVLRVPVMHLLSLDLRARGLRLARLRCRDFPLLLTETLLRT